MTRCCNLYMDNLTTLFQQYKLYIVDSRTFVNVQVIVVCFSVLSMCIVLAALGIMRVGSGESTEVRTVACV
jgi:hypothetical protein